MLRITSTLALLLTASTHLFAEGNWPEFRGPNGNGHADVDQTPLRWSGKSNVVWKKPIAGQGWSSPVLSDGKIYLTAAVPESEEAKPSYALKLLVIACRTGEIEQDTLLFKQAPDAPKIHRKNSHASPTALIEGDRVYVHFGHQGTACVTKSGRIVWENDKLKYKPVHGNGGSPILVDNALIFSCDGAKDPFVVALDKNTGESLWKTPRKSDAKRNFSFSTPQLIEVNGQKQVVSPGSNCVVAYDPRDGSEIWRVRYDGYSVIPKPVYANGLVYVCTGYDSPSLYCIDPSGRGDVTDSHVRWTIRKSVPHTPSLLAISNEIYMVSDKGVAACIDAKTGEANWTKRLGGGFSASPLYAGGHIYFTNEDGETTVIRPGRSYEKVAENSLGERTLASFGVEEKTLYIRTEQHLYRIGS